MCIIPDGEFIAPFDIECVKVLGAYRGSEWYPGQRESFDPDAGAYLEYPQNTIVDSPGGPGIHVYFNDLNREQLATMQMQTEDVRRMYIHAFIPRGTRVSFELGSPGIPTVLVADTIVTRS